MFIRIGNNRIVNEDHIVKASMGEIDGGKIVLLLSTGESIEVETSEAPDLVKEFTGEKPPVGRYAGPGLD